MLRTFAAGLAALTLATGAYAGPIKLTPADPQPSGLTQGLAVKYALDHSFSSVDSATQVLKSAKKGTPLAGFDYRDTAEGDETLTSGQPYKVVADISGYVRFDEAGTYTMQFMANDGLIVEIAGQEVGYLGGKGGCRKSDPVEVSVPSAGWYDFEAIYFQHKGTACLHMKAGIGKAKWMENESFGY